MKELLDKVSKEAIRVNEGYSKQEIMNVLANDLQVLMHPLSVPKPMLEYLKGTNLSQRQLEVLVSMAVKILAYAGSGK
ncbi:MAG: hypothetical protein ACRDAQ_06320 [Cetobacterium sp.]